METVIREISSDELSELLRLYEYLHSDDEPLPGPAIVESVWSEIQRDPAIKYFGVFVDGRLIASCAITIIPNLTRGCRPYGLIENVVTHESLRRKGYGRSVLNAALECAWGKDCYKVMLMTGRRNEGIYGFYESAGFDRNGKQAFLARPPHKHD